MPNVGQNQPGFKSKKKQREEDEEKKQEAKQRKESDILNLVFEHLGRPREITFARASNVFDNRWRVSIWSGNPQRCTDSFFLVLNDDGTIKTSNPPLERKYL
jgi:hypothetical protein